MTDEIRADVLKELRAAAETNNVAADKYRADADAKQAEASEMRARAGYFTAMADRWTRIATFIENGTFDLDYLLSGDDLDEARRAGAAAEQAPHDATEAFVDVADAERYALRDDYVNAAPDLVGAMNRHSSNHGTAAAYDPADPHDAALAEQARAEHVDYAEAEAVREIEREMDRDAGDDSEIDRQAAEDDARNEREYEAHEASEAWLDAHPDEFEPEDAESVPDPAQAFDGLGSTWADPAVRRAVRETIAESEA